MNFCFLMSKGPSFDRFHPMGVDVIQREVQKHLPFVIITILQHSHQILHSKVSNLEGSISFEIKFPLISRIEIETPREKDSSAQ